VAGEPHHVISTRQQKRVILMNEETPGRPVYGQSVPAKPVVVPTGPTQTRHPVRAMLRTVLAVALPLIAVLPQLVDASGAARYGWSAALLAAAATVTRVLAVPGVNGWLAKYLPPLAAAPAKP
jgi:hypothetical protein